MCLGVLDLLHVDRLTSFLTQVIEAHEHHQDTLIELNDDENAKLSIAEKKKITDAVIETLREANLLGCSTVLTDMVKEDVEMPKVRKTLRSYNSIERAILTFITLLSYSCFQE